MIKKLTRAFWRTFYKLTLKDSYKLRLGNSTRLVSTMTTFTNGGIGQNYNSAGEKIRGVYRATSYSFEHPLVRKYAK